MKKQNESKQGKFRMWKSGKSWLYAGVLFLVVGGSTGAVMAQSGSLKLFNAPARTLPAPPTSGMVNYEYSGTGTVQWSNGYDTSANFMKINEATTFCLDPFTDVFNGANATQAGQNEAAYKQWNAMTEYQRHLINNITYIGEVNNAAADKNINLATQFALWLVEAGQNSVSGLLPTVTEIDTSQLNNIVDDHKITGLESTGADLDQVIQHATVILKQAVASAKSPEFTPDPLTVIAGSSAISTDKSGVLAGGAGGYGTPFDIIRSTAGLSAERKENSLEVSATPEAIGQNGKVDVFNNPSDFIPHYIYGTINPDSSVGQTLFATTAPARLEGQLNVNTIGLGQATLLKEDSDTESTETQGAAYLENSEWGLFYKSDNKPVLWKDGHKGYPITSTSGEKVSDDNVTLRMTDVKKGVGVKNLDFSKDVYWQETKAPEGYELSTKKYDVHFDKDDKFDKETSNYIEEATAIDRVASFSFMFEKAQDINGSLTGLNGAEFTATPQEGTLGNPIKVTSKSGTDSNGFMVNGLTVFDGAANLEAGNPSKAGLAIGSYLIEETKTPDGLQPIHPFLVTFTTNKDDEGNITSYTAEFKDTITGQIISTNDVPVDNLTDNNILFKLNMGMFTDKPIETLKPTLVSQATDQTDGDKLLGVGDAQINDKVMATGLEAETTYTLESQPVSKADGKPLKDTDGKPSLMTQEVTTDKEGNFTIDVISKTLDTTGLQEKAITLLTKVKDKAGKVVVEDQNYKNNPTETVEVDKAEGRTQVQDKEITPETTTVTDKFFYEGLVKGNTYTVKITQAYDHDLKKVIAVDGSLIFKATDSESTVDVPVKIDTKKYEGHTITFYEDTYVGEKPSDKDKAIISNHNKEDVNETLTIKANKKAEKPVTSKAETPKETPKGILPSTGEEKALWTFAGLSMVLIALAIVQREKIKGLFNKKQK
ncbi:VaFE repeat-containing surface-anchored protein [Lactococcus garvieae]|uniref:VaFE repeat-containing surface-anchored protein n=1 Tax=Lactococcus garvieae TaxID=1363 RepID=UPI0030CC9A1E